MPASRRANQHQDRNRGLGKTAGDVINRSKTANPEKLDFRLKFSNFSGIIQQSQLPVVVQHIFLENKQPDAGKFPEKLPPAPLIKNMSISINVIKPNYISIERGHRARQEETARVENRSRGAKEIAETRFQGNKTSSTAISAAASCRIQPNETSKCAERKYLANGENREKIHQRAARKSAIFRRRKQNHKSTMDNNSRPPNRRR